MTPPVLATVLAAILLASCGADTATVAMVPSSFTSLTDEIDSALDTETDWIIAGSTRLVSQLADGATADVLVTADAETMNDAVERGLVAGSPVTVATNRLVVAVAPGNPGGLGSLDDLRRNELLVGVCATEVPCGRLAAQVQEALNLAFSVDTEEPNVRSLALKIAGGELDAGLVYATDAQELGLDILDDSVLAAFVTEYLAVSVAGGPVEIIDFLVSGDGRDLLSTAGFLAP